MIYEQFIQKIKDLGIEINKKTEIDDINEKMFSGNVPRYYDEKEWKNIKPRFDFIIQYWEIGGTEGGSCWEDSNPQDYTTDKFIPKSFDDLDKILENICPNITYLQYKNLEKKTMIFKATQYEYYSNNTQYQVRYINLQKLYEFLVKECNLLGIGN